MIRKWPQVLMYHSISRLAAGSDTLCTPPERFEAQMLYLERRNLRGVSMEELYRAAEIGDARGLIGLTFDDGYEDFLDNAIPILKSMDFSATVFVPADMLGKENTWDHRGESRPRMKLLDADGVREVSEHGMEVGAHSLTHPRLPNLDVGALDREVSESRQKIGEIVNKPVSGFCYPYGNLSIECTRSVRKAGYLYACATKKRVDNSVYDWPRISVGEKDSSFRLWAKLNVDTPYLRAVRGFVRNLQSRRAR